MARGFLSGVIAGGCVSVLGLAVVSLQNGSVPHAPIAPTQIEQTEIQAEPTPVVRPDEAAENAQAAAPTPDPATPTETVETPTETVETPAPDEVPTPLPEKVEVPAPTSTDAAAPIAVEPEVAAPAQTALAVTEAPAEAPAEVAPTQENDAAATDVAEENASPAGAAGSVEASEQPAPAIETPEPAPADEAEAGGGLSSLAPPPSMISEPVTPITDRANGVTTNRLPSIAASAENEQAGASSVEPAPAQLDRGFSLLSLAIERNAIGFENPEGRPMMAVVLMDVGPQRTQLQGLAALPFPISVIVEATAEDAQAAIEFYQRAGAEVMVEATLPPGSTPSDAEVNFQVQAPLIEQGVAVFMDANSGFQTDALLAQQVSEILVASGHGLVSVPQGLSTGHKTALKAGVMAGMVFRDLDGEGQDSKVIGRFLDNAAFKARQEEGVILLGRARPETVQALVQWSLGNRVSSVAMAPISALLLGG